MKHSLDARLMARLRQREALGRLRTPHEGPYPELSFSTNDYLGLAREPVALAGNVGAGASRLVAGQTDAHRTLERSVASWLGFEEALVFTSGYAANVGAIASLVGTDDHVFSDVRNHASIIDGVRLSGTRAVRFPHNDVDALEQMLRDRPNPKGARWVVTESYFSMDADTPDLARLRSVCDAHNAFLVLDETHALGVFGPEGRGQAAHAKVKPDVLLGAFGKALGAQGGFVAGTAALRTYLWNHARSFVFSTGLSPLLAEVLCMRVPQVRAADALRATLHQNAAELRAALAAAHGPWRTLGHGPIVPLEVSSEQVAVVLSQYMYSAHIHIYPIRPPTAETSRLRLAVTALHTPPELHRLVETLSAAAQALH